MKHLPTPSHGVTLVEMLVGVTALGVLLAVAAPSLSDMMERRRVIAAAGEISSVLTYAKSEANAIGSRLNVHMESDPSKQYSCISVVSPNSLNSCKCYQWAAKTCSGAFSSTLLREFSLPRSGNNVLFDASAQSWGPIDHVISINRNQYFSDISGVGLTVTGPRTGVQLRVEFNNAGRVSICSPEGKMSGYPVCE